MKRKLTTLTTLLTILALGCNAQEPSLKYSVEYHDSVVNNYEQRISNFQSILDTYDNSEISVIADTFNFEIVDDRIKVELNKAGHDIQIDVIDSDTIIHVTYIDYKRKVILSE